MNLVRPLLALLVTVLGGCAYPAGLEPDYVSEETPGLVAEAEIVVLLCAAADIRPLRVGRYEITDLAG